MDSPSTSGSDLAAQAVQVCLCLHARKGARAITQLFDHVLAPTGLKATQISLLMVVASQESIRIGDLANALVTDSTSVSRTIKPLLAKSLIDISRDAEDRRIKTVRLTEAGRRQLDLALPLWQIAQSQSVQRLGNSTVQALLPALDAASQLGAVAPRKP